MSFDGFDIPIVIIRGSHRRSSHVVLDRQVLAAHHPVALEPLAAELLGGALRGVGPLDGDAVVVGGLGRRVDGVAGDGDVDALLRVQHTVRRVHVQALPVGGLEGEADAVAAGVEDLGKWWGNLRFCIRWKCCRVFGLTFMKYVCLSSNGALKMTFWDGMVVMSPGGMEAIVAW